MENKESEEYKKRIRDLVDRVEKNKDKDSTLTEQDVIEAKERLLQSIKRRTQESKFRSEFIIATLTYWIRSYYKKRTEKEQFQEEIDVLYELINEQMKKPNFYIPNSNFDPKRPNPLEMADRRRIIRNMMMVLSVEDVDKDFVRKYKPKNSGYDTSFTKEILWCVLTVIGGTLAILYFVWRYSVLP